MPEPDQPETGGTAGGRRWRRWILAVLALIAAVIVAGVIVVLVKKPHNVSHPDISFTVTTGTTTTQTTTRPQTNAQANNFAWPFYGLNFGRTRQFTGQANLHPPFRQGWTLGHNQLLEFPPVIFGHTLFYMDDGANVKAVDSLNGRVRWTKNVGKLSSASPGLAISQRILVVPTLSDTGGTPGDGQVVALSMTNGRILWHHPIASGAEGSPVIVRNTVFYGDQAGTVFSANVKTGKINWTFQASGSVKGGVAISGNNLYLDDYGGHVYDIDPRNGQKIWEASADGGSLGFSGGTFYSTPTVAYGRVYVGNTSGFIYSFAASNGALAWSYGTGEYVYSSAAVADVPGLGPTVYMGSYNGKFYAFNAQSGAVRWVHEDIHHDRISGSATVVNGVVYYSDLDDKATTGLDAKTGKVVFNFPDGAFSPVVADAGHIYLSGGYVLYQLNPKEGLAKAVAEHNGTAKKAAPLSAAAKRKLAAQRAAARRAAAKKAAAKRAAQKRAAARQAAQRRADAKRTAQRRAELRKKTAAARNKKK